MTVRVGLIGWLVACLSELLAGQTPSASVTIGNTEITLGMSAEQAINNLREEFKVVDVVEPTIHRWIIENKTKPNQIIGFLYANKKAIEGVEHLVFSRNLETAEDVFNALYDTSSKHSRKTKSTCVVSTWTSYDPVGLSVAGVLFICEAYRYRLIREQYKSDRENLAAVSFEVWEEVGSTNNFP